MAKPATGFIFDFDGVVVDSLGAHLRAWDAAVLALFNAPLTNPSRLIGHSTVAIAVLLAEEYGAPARAPDLVRLKREFLENLDQPVCALPGAAELFHNLAAGSIPWGIASNANRAFIEQTLGILGLAVPTIVAVEDVKKPKPAPDVFLLCATRLGISPADHRRTIVFEDSAHGISAAVKAGMFAVGVTTQHPAKILLAAGASETCRNLAEALERNWLIAPPI